jgi:PAS domain S-box-containing protein
VTVIVLGAAVFAALLPRATLTPVPPLLFLILLSSLFSAFKVQFPIASGSNMSVSYVVDIAALILYGPHTTMIVGAASGWSQTTFNAASRNPAYRTLFNMAILVLTAQAAGHVYEWLGGTSTADVNTLTLLLAAAPMYLTYKVYRAGIQTEARQGAILEAAHDAIITMDQGLNIREFNPAAEQMFGYSRMDILGRNVELLLPPAERGPQMATLREYMTHGTGPLAGRQHEMTAQRADGLEFPVELSVAKVGGESSGAITGFVRDITGRRALEEQLRQSQKLEAIGRLAGGVAHDFNNILMSIMGSADLLLMQLPADDAARGEAAEIKQSVHRGAGLTRQLLMFSRRQASSPRLVELDEVIAAMETMLRRLMGPEIEFDIRRPAQPVTVVADSAQMEQVVLNLVINARDAMPDGGRLTVTIDEVEFDESASVAHVEGRAGRYARLSVSDTGTGIDEHTRAKLFEPFFTTKEQGKGTGLGLSIVYGIVKQSAGYITVLSEPGKGATFLIYLPLATAAEPSPVLA